jgi:hypothetical protein
MSKITKNFEITYPLKHKIVRDLRIITETVGYLVVSGVAYCDTNVPKTDIDERYSVDVDFINWNGVDITPVLEVTGGHEEVVEYVIERVAELFTEEIAA